MRSDGGATHVSPSSHVPQVSRPAAAPAHSPPLLPASLVVDLYPAG